MQLKWVISVFEIVPDDMRLITAKNIIEAGNLLIFFDDLREILENMKSFR